MATKDQNYKTKTAKGQNKEQGPQVKSCGGTRSPNSNYNGVP